jgi:hypothetical protein
LLRDAASADADICGVDGPVVVIAIGGDILVVCGDDNDAAAVVVVSAAVVADDVDGGPTAAMVALPDADAAEREDASNVSVLSRLGMMDMEAVRSEPPLRVLPTGLGAGDSVVSMS